jgi:hypothetical protein
MQRTRSLFTRFLGLSKRERKLLIEAVFSLSFASAVVAVFPFARAIRFGCVPLRSRQQGRTIAECAWAVETGANVVPWRTVCIQKGLAAQWLLRRSNVDATLHYGARREPQTGKLEAHVWVTAAGEPVIGTELSAEFAELVAYPPGHPRIRS